MYFFSAMDALTVCETTAITPSIFEQAANLGLGIWHIPSVNAEFLFYRIIIISKVNLLKVIC